MTHESDHQGDGPTIAADRWQVAYWADTPLTHAGWAAGFLPFVEHVSTSYATEEEARRGADGLIGTARDGGTVLWHGPYWIPHPAPRTPHRRRRVGGRRLVGERRALSRSVTYLT